MVKKMLRYDAFLNQNGEFIPFKVCVWPYIGTTSVATHAHYSDFIMRPVTGGFPHKGPMTRKMFPFDDVIMILRAKTDL